MDPRFDEMFDDPFNQIFKVVFYPDRVYHAAYFNATRSTRYRYNVREVRNAFDVIVLKARSTSTACSSATCCASNTAPAG